MVLFYEEKKKKERTRRSRLIRLFFRIVIVLAIMTAISLTILSHLGGKSEALRLGVQDYLTESSGYIAEIGTLHDMAFFPTTRLSFDRLSFSRAVLKPQDAADGEDEGKDEIYPQIKTANDIYDAGQEVGRIGSGTIAMSFWDMFFSRRRFLELDVQNVHLDSGIWLPHAVDLDYLKVVQEGEDFFIRGSGTYGAEPLTVSYAIQAYKTRQGRIVFQLQDDSALSVSLGPLKIEGFLEGVGSRAVTMRLTKLEADKQEFSGHVTMERQLSGLSVVSEIKTGSSVAVADLVVADDTVNGALTFEKLDVTDYRNTVSSYQLVRRVLGLEQERKNIHFGTHKYDLDVRVKALSDADRSWGMLAGHLQIDPYLLKLSDISGELGGGTVQGSVLIDATGKEPFLKSAGKIADWDYARLQANATGQASTHWDIRSEGQSFDDLARNRKGEVVTIAGAGTFNQKNIMYWGTGLLTAMLPSLSSSDDMVMNCMVADFNIEGNKATTQTLFMDLKDLTVTGEGSVDIAKMALDLTLKPKPKEISILDGGVAVKVTGDIASPRIAPDRFSIGKKLGGLFLGTINPVFFAVSLTDLGLNEKHPCHKYLNADLNTKGPEAR